MLINRCVCTSRTFVELLHLARQNGYHLDKLVASTDAGNACSRCLPYLRRMLDSDQTEFYQLITEDPAPASGDPGDPP